MLHVYLAMPLQRCFLALLHVKQGKRDQWNIKKHLHTDTKSNDKSPNTLATERASSLDCEHYQAMIYDCAI